MSQPLVEAIGRNQTSAKFQRITERRLCGGCLRLRIYRARRDRRGFCPMRNETPLHQSDFTYWLFRILANHRDRLGRSDVVAGSTVFLARDAIEVLLNNLLSPRESIARTWGIISDRQDHSSVEHGSAGHFGSVTSSTISKICGYC